MGETPLPLSCDGSMITVVEDGAVVSVLALLLVVDGAT